MRSYMRDINHGRDPRVEIPAAGGREGAEMFVTYLPGEGTTVAAAGGGKVTVPGKEFADAAGMAGRAFACRCAGRTQRWRRLMSASCFFKASLSAATRCISAIALLRSSPIFARW